MSGLTKQEIQSILKRLGIDSSHEIDFYLEEYDSYLADKDAALSSSQTSSENKKTA